MTTEMKTNGVEVLRRTNSASSGFTLIELLTVVAIIAILGAVAVAGTSTALRVAAQARDTNAAHDLVSAYLTAASETGRYLAGMDRTVSQVDWPNGNTVSGPAANRYPYRLGQYYGYDLESVILVGENAEQINTDDSYMVSLMPAFGINYLFVGGDRQADGSFSLNGEVITKASHWQNVIVFASAGRASDGEIVHGYNILTPPQIHGEMWSSRQWTPTSPPDDYGNVDARYKGKAIAAFLDGSVRLMDIDELRDMRLWSRRAAETNNPNYTVTVRQPAGGGGRR